jgi:RNA 2',3'-cyclic 3'-phosphodiesterase
MPETGARKRRLFVGIELDEEARARCASVSEELRKAGLSARYEAPEKLHVTLAFLGFVQASRLDEILAPLHDIASASLPFSLSLDKVGAFPHERRPRIVYAGAREQGARFRALAESMRNAYAALGFEFKNDAIAHVTLARVKESKRALSLIEFSPIPLQIQALALFESLPDPARTTSRYEVITTAPLAPPSS